MHKSSQVVSSGICALILTSIGISIAWAGPGGMAAPVKVVEAQKIDLAPSIWVAGSVISRRDSRLSSEVEGRVVYLPEVGDVVTASDVVAKVDATTIQMQLEEARAEISPIEAKLNFYQGEVVRLEKLAKENNAAKNRLDEVISDRDQMRGELSMKKTRLAQARDKLQRTTIHAPFGGIVAEKLKEEGEWAKVGDELLRLVNTDTIEIQGRVQQENVPFLQKGQQIEVTDGNNIVLATVKTLVPVGDSVSRLYEVRLDFDSVGWMAGHAVKIKVPTSKPKAVMAVPRDALVIRENTIKIFRILEDSSAEAVVVKTGIASDDVIEVIGNVTEGDKIVIRGNERLRPQQKVKIIQER